jgi:hypothetical protein
LEECLASLDWRHLLEGPRTWCVPMTVDWSIKRHWWVSNNKHNNIHCSIISTYCCNARLDVVLGPARRREVVWGWNKDDSHEVVLDEMSEILVMSTQWAKWATSSPCALGNRSFHVR